MVDVTVGYFCGRVASLYMGHGAHCVPSDIVEQIEEVLTL